MSLLVTFPNLGVERTAPIENHTNTLGQTHYRWKFGMLDRCQFSIKIKRAANPCRFLGISSPWKSSEFKIWRISNRKIEIQKKCITFLMVFGFLHLHSFRGEVFQLLLLKWLQTCGVYTKYWKDAKRKIVVSIIFIYSKYIRQLQ